MDSAVIDLMDSDTIFNGQCCHRFNGTVILYLMDSAVIDLMDSDTIFNGQCCHRFNGQ